MNNTVSVPIMDQAENQYNFFFPHPSTALQKEFMDASIISSKPSSSAREKRENKISSHFQLKKKPVIFETVRIQEDTLCEKPCQTHFLKKRSASDFFKYFVVNS